MLAIRRILREGWQNVVLAFLEGPCLYAELARIPRQRWGLVAGERCADPRILGRSGRWLRQTHRLADAVVSNSHTNRLMLEGAFPFLKQKLATVYNTVDLELFSPALAPPPSGGESRAKALRIVVAASYQEKKNMMGVAEALLYLKRNQSKLNVVVDWFGHLSNDPAPFKRAERFVAENDLGESLRLHQNTRDIAGEYARADAVGLFSFFEGLPNAVCEGMACGKPILMSDVCDAGNLVVDGKNGLLCDPGSSESIANAFVRLAGLSLEERRQMGLLSRSLAEHLFNKNMVIESYEKIFELVVHQKAVSSGCSWPTKVPKSTLETVGAAIGSQIIKDE